jgi:hypothetical protein
MGGGAAKKDSEQLLGEVIQKVLTETRLARPYVERRAVMVWKETVGPLIVQCTSKVELKGDTLYVYVLSPLVRNELQMLREEILVKMHREIDERLLKKIVIR